MWTSGPEVRRGWEGRTGQEEHRDSLREPRGLPPHALHACCTGPGPRQGEVRSCQGPLRVWTWPTGEAESRAMEQIP